MGWFIVKVGDTLKNFFFYFFFGLDFLIILKDFFDKVETFKIKIVNVVTICHMIISWDPLA